MSPKVSVVMTTYNHQAFIGQAVTSVMEQEVDFDYELIIGEDCSTDGTRDILLAFQAKYPDRIRLLLREENWGRRRNFLDTFQASQGDYVAILEGDDYWASPHKLQRQVDFLDSHPNCSICFHPVKKRYENGNRGMEIQRPFPPQTFYHLKDLLTRVSIVTCSMMFRNGLLGGFPDWLWTVPAADLPLGVLLAEKGRIGYIDEVMAVYRIHSGGVWASKGLVERKKMRIEILKTLQNYLDVEYREMLEESIARSQLRIAAFLWHNRDFGGLLSHLTGMVFERTASFRAVGRVARGAMSSRAENREKG